jgi:hypothetical protein
MGTEHTLRLIGEFLTQGGHAHGVDPDTLDREAALVAAAPDMLAALEYAAGKLISLADAETDDQEMWIIDDIERVIRTAFAKATGEI